MNFCALHISDIHYSDEPSDVRAARSEILKKIQEENLPADCLIISGDLFNRGALKKEEVQELRSFLGALPGRAYTVVVPGNHDIDRSAQFKNDASFNDYITRKTLAYKFGEDARINGEFSFPHTGKKEKSLMYDKTFHDFFSFAAENGFKSLCTSDCPFSPDNYEVKSFYNSFGGITVRFVLLNTALLAGQAVCGVEYQRRCKELLKKIHVAEDSVDEAKCRLALAKQQNRFEKEGELVVDEEITDDTGRLSLSKEGNSLLHNLSHDKNAMITIFVGHHGFQYLSKRTQEALKQAMRTCQTELYLCGHSHKARYLRFPIQANTFPQDLRQTQAGVAFKDETEYAQYGFNYLSFSVNQNQVDASITLYYLVKGASGEYRWDHEVISYKYSLPTPPPALAETENIVTASTIPQEENTLFPSETGNTFLTHRITISDVLDDKK